MPFTNLSAMDGIVVNKKSLSKNKQYEVVGESKSGIKVPILKIINVCFIYTGAPLPKGSKIIVPKENCEYTQNKKIKINKIPDQDYIRIKGSDIKKND